MRKLDLVLEAKWYDMIASGEKREEYREDKVYWRGRLLRCYGEFCWCDFPCRGCPVLTTAPYKDYTQVRFHRGYTKTTMLYEIKEITYGRGNPDWGAPDKDVFIIKLGKEVSRAGEVLNEHFK